MAFTDNFNRSAEDLEASANWTRVDGSAGAARVNASNQLRCVSEAAYQCPDQSSANHYTQAALETEGDAFPIATRVTDKDNYIAARVRSTNVMELYKKASGSFSLLGSYGSGISAGDTLYLESDSSDNHTVKHNGTTRIGPVSDAFNNTETRQGLIPRAASYDPWIDDFEAGALGAPPAGAPPPGSLSLMGVGV